MIDTEALRKKVIDLAIQGKLTEQLPADGDAGDLYAQILEHKLQLIKEGKIKKEKGLPPITVDEIPFEIPNNWKWVRLYEISDTNIGLTYHPENVVDEGIVVLRSNNIKNGVFDYSDLVHVNCKVRENQYIRQNDILICSRNGSKNLVGKCAIYDGKLGDVSFGAFMAILRTSLFKYVYYYLTTDMFRRYFSSDDTKQINQVTQDILKKAIVPFPPYAEQRRIVEKIDSVLEQLE
ncbi:MAG: restriction endonuclease subunit S [Oribacterium sp.]|nr:restriction endonuclease subunit S [Oribacterium sp.]